MFRNAPDAASKQTQTPQGLCGLQPSACWGFQQIYAERRSPEKRMSPQTKPLSFTVCQKS